MEISEIIRSLREDRDLTQGEVAKVLDTTQQYYSEYELAKRDIPLKHLKTLCQFYHVSADYILGLPDNLEYPKR